MAAQERKCITCHETKLLQECFYKSGSGYRKYCKSCHNIKRKNYKCSNIEYVKRPTGFDKLPVELRNKIAKDVHENLNVRAIHAKYHVEHAKLNYQVLLRWKRQGKIPKPSS